MIFMAVLIVDILNVARVTEEGIDDKMLADLTATIADRSSNIDMRKLHLYFALGRKTHRMWK